MVKFYKSKVKIGASLYQTSLKIFHHQTDSGEELNLGSEFIDSNWLDLLNNLQNELLNNRQLKLRETSANTSSFANPSILMRLNSPATFQMGTEIPIVQTTLNQSYTDWKFAGLKGKFVLTKKNNALFLDYDTELSFPNFSGTKEKSSISIRSNSWKKIFTIVFKYDQDNDSKLPLLGKIPVFGNLFSSKSQNRNWHKISGFVKIEEVNQIE